MKKIQAGKVRPRTYLINGDHVTAVCIPWFIYPRRTEEFRYMFSTLATSMADFESVIEETTEELKMMNKALHVVETALKP